MRAVTIREAKAQLNELIDAAERGEQVVIMRGSRHVATIVPISEAQLEIAPEVTDAQAERFWTALAQERQRGGVREFERAEDAVAFLRAPRRASRRTKAPARRKR